MGYSAAAELTRFQASSGYPPDKIKAAGATRTLDSGPIALKGPSPQSPIVVFKQGANRRYVLRLGSPWMFACPSGDRFVDLVR